MHIPLMLRADNFMDDGLFYSLLVVESQLFSKISVKGCKIFDDQLKFKNGMSAML